MKQSHIAAFEKDVLAASLYRLPLAVDEEEARKFVLAIQLLRSCRVPEEAEPTLLKGGVARRGQHESAG